MTRNHTFMPWRQVLLAAATFTTSELCIHADEARAAGSSHLEAGWLEALSLHAKRCGWGELVEAGMLASIERKEDTQCESGASSQSSGDRRTSRD